MNEISNHKNEMERLKQVANQENNLNMENHSALNLVNYQISFFQRENAFIKTELNNKQNIKKLLSINCNQSSFSSSKININEDDRVNEKNSKGNPLKYKDKNSSENLISNGKPDSYKRNPPKTKVTITGD